jgi:hypothetical protein
MGDFAREFCVCASTSFVWSIFYMWGSYVFVHVFLDASSKCNNYLEHKLYPTTTIEVTISLKTHVKK